MSAKMISMLLSAGTAVASCVVLADAKTCVWKGAAASTAWSETANWENGNVPVAGDAVRIPGGKIAPMATTDNTLAASLSGIEIAEGGILVLTNVSNGATLSTPLSGKGRLWISNCNGNVVKISGDNRAFEGDFSMSNTQVQVTSKYSLGTTNVVWFSGSSRRLVFATGGTFSNEIHVAGTQYIEQQSSAVLAGAVYAETSDFKFYGGGNHNYRTTIAGKFGTKSPSLLRGDFSRDVRFLASAQVDVGKMQFECRAGYIDFNCKYHTKPRTGSSVQARSNLELSDKGNKLTFGIENAFDADIAICGRYFYSCSTAGGEVIDLCGFNQRVGTLSQCTTGWTNKPYDCDPTSTIRSDTPATLTILDTFSNSESDSAKNVYLSTVTGQASLELNSTNTPSAAGAIKFNCPGSTTTGGLLCRRGTMTLMSSCTFPNLTKLEATGEGNVVVQTSNVANEGKSLSVVVSNLTDTVALTLSEGVTLGAKTAYVGTKWLQPGTYGSADAVAAAGKGRALQELSGLGLMTVEKFGGKKGLVLVFR